MEQYLLFLVFLLTWLVVSSFFEWTLHRFFMHRPVGPFLFPFRSHALRHHRYFRADHSYHLEKQEEKGMISMAWWSGPLLVLICALPAFPISVYFSQPAIYWGSLLGAILYYGVSEYLHWCMHVPRSRRLESARWFRRLNAHHLLHHRYMHKNFNVLLPIADKMLGTFISRAHTRFSQPSKELVPDVQPTHKRVSDLLLNR